MTFNNLQTTEPAFLSNQKAAIRMKPVGYHKNLHDCCYSVSNLASIVASVLALVFLIKFLNDDPLYEFGEHLLTLRFYRQLIYIIVILPLILLVPIFNATSAFFLSDQQNYELKKSLLIVKLMYQVLMAILVFIALAFIAPSIRYGSVATQLGHELRKHMKRRYENDFSYEFLDRIQEEYQCCDEVWYRANYNEKVPLSCTHIGSNYSIFFDKSCAEVLGVMVSNRCTVIAVSLVVILVALASLVGIDILELLTYYNQQYYVDSRETKLELNTTSQTRQAIRSNSNLDSDNDEDDSTDDISNRLRLNERELDRTTPLLSEQSRTYLQPIEFADGENLISKAGHLTPIITRSNYINNRPQSPVFVQQQRNQTDNYGQQDNQSDSLSLKQINSSPKSVLKKSSSFQRIDSDEESDVQEFQRQMQRELQTRRSMLNVRFAE